MYMCIYIYVYIYIDAVHELLQYTTQQCFFEVRLHQLVGFLIHTSLSKVQDVCHVSINSITTWWLVFLKFPQRCSNVTWMTWNLIRLDFFRGPENYIGKNGWNLASPKQIICLWLWLWPICWILCINDDVYWLFRKIIWKLNWGKTPQVSPAFGVFLH